MIDILVVSHACVTSINRIPYRRLANMGWRVEIVTANRLSAADISREADPPEADDPPMHFLPLRAGTPRFWSFDGLRRVVDSRNPRIIVLDYDPGSRLTIEVGWWTRGRGTRIVCFSYDNMPRTLSGELRNWSLGGAGRVAAIKLLSKLGGLAVDHVWVLSNDSARAVEALGFHGRVSKIPLGFEPSKFKPDPDRREAIRNELGLHDVTFAYFGRLVPEKGVHLLIRALYTLSEYPWQLLLDRFGDYPHPYERDLESLIKTLGIEDRVVFFDAPHDRVAEYMNAADVVVVPSIANSRWKEQYGRVAPEAMACGKLVIVSDSGALPELVGAAGIIVPHSNIEALADAARQVMNDRSLLQRFSVGARELALGRFSLPVQVQQMHELFSTWVVPSMLPGPPA
jgi:glycosyltransferase involved in cell wall biosynthesis